MADEASCKNADINAAEAMIAGVAIKASLDRAILDITVPNAQKIAPKTPYFIITPSFENRIEFLLCLNYSIFSIFVKYMQILNILIY